MRKPSRSGPGGGRHGWYRCTRVRRPATAPERDQLARSPSSVHPCTRATPPRTSSPSSTRPAVASQIADGDWVAHRDAAEHHERGPGVNQRSAASTERTPPPTWTSQPGGAGATTRATASALCVTGTPRAASRSTTWSRAAPASRNLRPVARGHPRRRSHPRIALAQAHAPAASTSIAGMTSIDQPSPAPPRRCTGRDEFAYTRNPAAPLFSGWNCVPILLPLSTAAATSPP